jgi:hypothetical protein
LKKAIETCWEKDIVVVVCATNEGQHAFLDEFAPQDLGTADNALITVGGVGADGKYYTDTANSRGSGMLNVGGNLDLFAGAIDVTVAKHDGGFDDTVQDSGTSLATPAVVISPISLLALILVYTVLTSNSFLGWARCILLLYS